MKSTLSFYISYALFLLSANLIIADNLPQQQQQIAFNSQTQIENELFQLTDDLFETESILTSCSSCISLLQVLKKMSYMSEGFLISTLTKMCKRTQKVDNEVVIYR